MYKFNSTMHFLSNRYVVCDLDFHRCENFVIKNKWRALWNVRPASRITNGRKTGKYIEIENSSRFRRNGLIEIINSRKMIRIHTYDYLEIVSIRAFNYDEVFFMDPRYRGKLIENRRPYFSRAWILVNLHWDRARVPSIN